VELQIIFKNSNFVAIFKPSKTLSVPSRLGVNDPRPVVGIQLQELLGQTIFPVHRLDEDVSGILLFALTPDAHKIACSWFECHAVRKTYEAITPSLTELDQRLFSEPQTWECMIVRGKRRSFEAAHGKPSKTIVRFIESTMGVQNGICIPSQVGHINSDLKCPGMDFPLMAMYYTDLPYCLITTKRESFFAALNWIFPYVPKLNH
jgi:23S rRNA-/tRNA-specific pseudouridylate synthase